MVDYADFDYGSFAASLKNAIAHGLDYVALAAKFEVAGSWILQMANGNARPHPLIANQLLRELPNWVTAKAV